MLGSVTTAETAGGPGLFLAIWGIGATAMGWILVTDFHGAAGRLAQFSYNRGQFFWGRDPIRFVRTIAGIFAVIGPSALIVGAWHLGSDGIGEFFPRIPFWQAAVMTLPALGGAVLAWWITPSPLRRAWSGGLSLRIAVVAAIACLALLPLSLWVGQAVLTAAIVLFGIGAAVAMLVGPDPWRAETDEDMYEPDEDRYETDETDTDGQPDHAERP
jgi:hypothetical protein